MMEVPSTDWRATLWDQAEAIASAPLKGEWQALDGEVRHVFTHFELRLQVIRTQSRQSTGADLVWVAPDQLDDYALPTVMRKVIDLAFKAIP
jgi:A/G-specific adenine glycosylase